MVQWLNVIDLGIFILKVNILYVNLGKVLVYIET